jgi:hypothetical protein
MLLNLARFAQFPRVSVKSVANAYALRLNLMQPSQRFTTFTR